MGGVVSVCGRAAREGIGRLGPKTNSCLGAAVRPSQCLGVSCKCESPCGRSSSSLCHRSQGETAIATPTTAHAPWAARSGGGAGVKRVRVMLLLRLLRRRRLSRRGLGGLVFELDSVLESPDSLGEAGAQFRQLLRTEYQHGNSQNHQQVHRLEQTFKHSGELLSPLV
jgi:hypothetical protein